VNIGLITSNNQIEELIEILESSTLSGAFRMQRALADGAPSRHASLKSSGNLTESHAWWAQWWAQNRQGRANREVGVGCPLPAAEDSSF
jgi:hypothetical protein